MEMVRADHFRRFPNEQAADIVVFTPVEVYRVQFRLLRVYGPILYQPLTASYHWPMRILMCEWVASMPA